jgi:hypothetical protein
MISHIDKTAQRPARFEYQAQASVEQAGRSGRIGQISGFGSTGGTVTAGTGFKNRLGGGNVILIFLVFIILNLFFLSFVFKIVLKFF